MKAMTTKLILLIAALPVLCASASTGPIMQLFPTTVLEDIRETGEAAARMEDSLQEVINRLDLQQQLYTESRCAGADEDPGCERIARQLGATYLEMLQTMEDRLPAMEEAVNNTRSSLARRLRTELAEGTTPSRLQDLLLGRIEKLPAQSSPVALRGKSGVRLSSRFQQYYDLVARRSSGPSQSLAVIASDIYLDMEDAATLIAATREEIGRATLMEQLNQSLGQITPEMNEVVAGVKSILFGEISDSAPIAAVPDRSADAAFISPLEF